MAMYTMLRRACRSLLPLASRALEAPTPFRGAISAALNLRFSTLVKTSADEALVRVIDAGIECAQDFDTIATMPEGFPFRIQDHPGESTILMEREYRDETIQVRVDMPSPDDEDEEEEEEGDEDEEDEEDRSMIPMVVTISKGSGFYLEVGVTAFPDRISIDSLSMKHSDASDEQLLYEGPEFNELDKNLQKAFQKYLGVRGINANTSKLLYEYMTSKDQKEYLMWLKNFKQFILQ